MGFNYFVFLIVNFGPHRKYFKNYFLRILFSKWINYYKSLHTFSMQCKINPNIYFEWVISIISSSFSKQILYPRDLRNCQWSKTRNFSSQNLKHGSNLNDQTLWDDRPMHFPVITGSTFKKFYFLFISDERNKSV